MRHAAWAKRAGKRFFDLLIPRVCAGCGLAIDPTSGELCTCCSWEVVAAVGGTYCSRCGEDRVVHLLIDGRCTACRLGKPAGPRFDRFVRAGRYAGALRNLILRFKREYVLDRLLGSMLANAVQGQFDARMVDCWVPVPSHWRQRLWRGFQPTALLASACVRAWGGRVEPALSMTRYVQPFHTCGWMSAADRARAIKGAFRVVRPSLVGGRTVCVIDDVTTTGATLGEAKRALRAAGAGRVFAAVVAKASPMPLADPGVDPGAARDTECSVAPPWPT